MQFSEGTIGRVFALRLEHGEQMPDVLEQFCIDHDVKNGMAIMVGGADDGSRLVVGPEDGAALPVTPMVTTLMGTHEAGAVGTIFPNAEGRPVLHMHAACGREQSTITGCIRVGIQTWHILEIILIELNGLDMARLRDENTGFELLTRADCSSVTADRK